MDIYVEYCFCSTDRAQCNIRHIHFKLRFPYVKLNLKSTVELHLFGLIGTANHLDMQKIRIIGFLLENKLHWQFEVEKKILLTAILGYIFIHLQI